MLDITFSLLSTAYSTIDVITLFPVSLEHGSFIIPYSVTVIIQTDLYKVFVLMLVVLHMLYIYNNHNKF